MVNKMGCGALKQGRSGKTKSHGRRGPRCNNAYETEVRLTASNQRVKQGFQSMAALRSHLLSTNPRTRNLQDQNPSAEVVQTNGIHLVTWLNNWSSNSPFSSAKTIPWLIETLETSRPSLSATTGPLFFNGFCEFC